MDYPDYKHLLFERRDDGVLIVRFNRPEAYNATNQRLHWELTQVWRTIGEDPQTRVVVITGQGKAFSAGGEFGLIESQFENQPLALQIMKEASDIVYEMINLEKPVISAINGVAVGAGLAVALLADVSIIAQSVRLTDGHTRLGIAAGDHSVIIWPLLCGMAKAKYYLLTCDFVSAAEAERIGLVSLCVPDDELMDRALSVAHALGKGPQTAIRFTKKALNNWLRLAGPSFDASLALEMLCMFGDDVREGVKALKEKRPPKFNES